MISAEMLTGRSTEHLAVLSGNHRLQPAAVVAFQAMQQAAKAAGFNLQPASTFAISTGNWRSGMVSSAESGQY